AAGLASSDLLRDLVAAHVGQAIENNDELALLLLSHDRKQNVDDFFGSRGSSHGLSTEQISCPKRVQARAAVVIRAGRCMRLASAAARRISRNFSVQAGFTKC